MCLLFFVLPQRARGVSSPLQSREHKKFKGSKGRLEEEDEDDDDDDERINNNQKGGEDDDSTDDKEEEEVGHGASAAPHRQGLTHDSPSHPLARSFNPTFTPSASWPRHSTRQPTTARCQSARRA